MRRTSAALALVMMGACGGGPDGDSELDLGELLDQLANPIEDPCDRIADASEECGDPYTDAQYEACDAAYEECSHRDLRIVNDYMDCIEEAGLFRCDGILDMDQALVCQHILGSDGEELSDACLRAMEWVASATPDTGYR